MKISTPNQFSIKKNTSKITRVIKELTWGGGGEIRLLLLVLLVYLLFQRSLQLNLLKLAKNKVFGSYIYQSNKNCNL